MTLMMNFSVKGKILDRKPITVRKTMSEIEYKAVPDNVVSVPDQQQTSFLPILLTKTVNATPNPRDVNLNFKGVLLKKKWFVSAESKTQGISMSLYQAFQDVLIMKGQVRYYDLKVTIISKPATRGSVAIVTHAEGEPIGDDYYDLMTWPNAIGWTFTQATAGNTVPINVPVNEALSDQLYPAGSTMPAPYLTIHQDNFHGMILITMRIDCQKIIIDAGNF